MTFVVERMLNINLLTFVGWRQLLLIFVRGIVTVATDTCHCVNTVLITFWTVMNSLKISACHSLCSIFLYGGHRTNHLLSQMITHQLNYSEDGWEAKDNKGYHCTIHTHTHSLSLKQKPPVHKSHSNGSCHVWPQPPFFAHVHRLRDLNPGPDNLSPPNPAQSLIGRGTCRARWEDWRHCNPFVSGGWGFRN